MFKLFVVCFILGYVAADQAAEQLLAKVVTECQTDPNTRVSIPNMSKYFDNQPTDDPQIPKFWACFGKKLGYFHGNGKFRTETVRTMWADFYTPIDMETVIGCMTDQSDEASSMMEFFACKFRAGLGLSRAVLEMIKAVPVKSEL